MCGEGRWLRGDTGEGTRWGPRDGFEGAAEGDRSLGHGDSIPHMEVSGPGEGGLWQGWVSSIQVLQTPSDSPPRCLWVTLLIGYPQAQQRPCREAPGAPRDITHTTQAPWQRINLYYQMKQTTQKPKLDQAHVVPSGGRARPRHSSRCSRKSLLMCSGAKPWLVSHCVRLSNAPGGTLGLKRRLLHLPAQCSAAGLAAAH